MLWQKAFEFSNSFINCMNCCNCVHQCELFHAQEYQVLFFDAVRIFLSDEHDVWFALICLWVVFHFHLRWDGLTKIEEIRERSD